MAFDFSKFRPYQLEGTAFLTEHRGGILGDKMGLGKTAQVLGAWSNLNITKANVFATTNALWTWRTQILRWWPEMFDHVRIIHGQPHKRRAQLAEARQLEKCISIMTYGTLLHNRAEIPKAQAMACDEIHRRLRGRKTATLRELKALNIPRIFLMSGTPMSRGAQDIFPALQLLDPQRFTSYWKFVNRYCYVDEGMFGKQVYGTKNKEELARLLNRYMIARTKEQVADQLPPKLRQPVPIIPSAAQIKWQNDLIDEMYTDLEGTLIISESVLGNLIKLRKLMVSPKLLNPDAEWGASITNMLEMVDDLEEPHFVVFTPFRDGVDVITNALIEHGFSSDNIYRFMGGLKPEQVGQQEVDFRQRRGIAVCTIKYAQSFDLASATTGFFIGSEYSGDDNEQAEDRIHRLSSEGPVDIYYLINQGTPEEDVIDIVDGKFRNVSSIFASVNALRERLRGVQNEADAIKRSAY